MTIDNEAVHLMPFFGTVWTPNERWFVNSYLQVDVDANGDGVTGATFSTSGPPTQFIGRYRDTTFLYADIGVGYWARHTNDASRALTGLAYVCEFHMNQSLEGQQVLSSNGFQVGSPIENQSVFDITVGAHLEFYTRTTVTLAYCTPLNSDSDKQFDGQFRLLFNRRF